MPRHFSDTAPGEWHVEPDRLEVTREGPPGDLDDLSADSWNEVQRVLRTFERGWAAGGRPAIRDHLSDTGPHRRAILIELVFTELELRVKAGESPTVSEYLAHFPELRRDPSFIKQARAFESSCRLVETVCDEAGRHSDSAEDLTMEFSPPRLGRYELHDVVGEGSFGVVYRARDTELGRTVAVKVPRPGRLAAARDQERFLREARVAARLAHPAIVPVHDAGRVAGTLFLVCEFIEGTTLSGKLSEGPLPCDLAAEIIAGLAEALQHAHAHGIVHRDLKPSNILLDQSGRPRLTDFGLAKQKLDEASVTLEGQILGTPAYMSPEQALGDSHAVDGRSDIYSLGVLLYQAITGELPFRGSSRMVLQQILNEDPRPPSALNHLIPRDLETICLKCMAKSSKDRYPSAAALAGDLQLFLQREPIQTRPLGRAARLIRRAQRQPLPFLLSAGLAAAVVAGTLGVTWQWLETRSALHREQQQSRRVITGLRHANRVIALISRSYGKLKGTARPSRSELQRLIGKQSATVAALGDSYSMMRGRSSADARDTVALELALAHFNQGLLLRLAGRLDKADRAFQRASQFADERPRNRTDDYEAHRLSADILSHWARLSRERGQWTDAVRHFERRDGLLRWMVSRSSASAAVYRALAVNLVDLGQAMIETGRPARALSVLQEGASLLQAQIGDDEPSASDLGIMANLHIHIGRALDRLDRPAEAIESFQRATEMSERLFRDDPTSVPHRARLGMCYHALGNLHDDLHRPADAVEYFRRSLSIREALARDFPEEAYHRDQIKGTRMRLREQLQLLAHEPFAAPGLQD